MAGHQVPGLAFRFQLSWGGRGTAMTTNAELRAFMQIAETLPRIAEALEDIAKTLKEKT